MDIDAAIEAARGARDQAYAPYSGFRMGAAVVTSNGSTVTFPCGACLQVGLELGGPDLVVVAATVDGTSARGFGPVEQQRLADLLPRGPHTS